MENLIKYGIQLAMMNQLIAKKLITQNEYIAIKNYLIKIYKIQRVSA